MMRKFASGILVGFALLAFAAGESPKDQYCKEVYTCAGEEDPAAKCAEDKKEAEEEECDAACIALNAACEDLEKKFYECMLANGECKNEIFGAEAIVDQCKEDSAAYIACQADNA